MSVLSFVNVLEVALARLTGSKGRGVTNLGIRA